MLTLLTAVCAVPLTYADGHGGARTFSWVSQNVHFYDAARFTNAPIREQLEAALIAAFEARGLKFVDSIEDADLGLSYVAVLQNAASDEEIASFRSAHPDIASLPNDPQQFESGMLFAKLVERHTRVKIWDNTYRGLVALDMPEAPRKQRMDELITFLLSNYRP